MDSIRTVIQDILISISCYSNKACNQIIGMKVRIKNDERGLLFRDGNYIKSLRPGKYFFNPFVKYSIVISDINKAFDPAGKNINLFLEAR